MAESVELATLWLVDLVGSTRLEAGVGPVRAEVLRDEYFGLLREAIAQSGGREFKNTGDGLFVAFSSASAAIGCAVLTQQLFEWRYRVAERRLHVRIGLGTGEATMNDGDYFGMPSVEAARLCDRAPADGILVSATTRLLAGRVDGARFVSVGEIELEGIPEPMPAFSVLWEPLDPEQSRGEGGRWPLPEALRVAPRVAYVGREIERRRLEHVLQATRSGARHVVLLAGEPGIGKTRLASYAGLSARADGFGVCWGACSEELAAPYEPWIDVCTQLVEHADDDVLAEYIERFGGELAGIARNLSRRVPQAPPPRASDPETERFLLFKAVTELLRAVTAAVPVCVILDDFHWADAQSVALLRHVTRNVELGSLVLLVTYRDSEVARNDPLTEALAGLHRIDGVARITLAGLDSEEVAELMSAAAGHVLDEQGRALADELATETGGNPFFVGEILRSLTESGAITFDETAGRWSLEAAAPRVPESVRDVIGRRIDRLGGDGREVLRVAAVVGRSFDLQLLSRLVELEDARLLDLLEAAVDATLLRESSDQVGRFTFEHALINHTLYEGLGGTRRAQLHHRVAVALETTYGAEATEYLADLAMHWRLAAADSTKATAYSVRAGRQALGRLAPSDAAKLFTDALELLGADDNPERCDALIGLGEAQRLTGDAAFRTTLLDASRIASDLHDGDRATRAVLAGSRGIPGALGHTDQEQLAAIQRALELETDPERRAMLLSMQATELLYERDHHECRALAEQALALARMTGNPRTTGRVLSDYLFVLRSPVGLARRLEHLDELRASAEAAGDPALTFWAAIAERNALVEDGQLARAQDAAQRMEVVAEQVGDPSLRWRAVFSGRGCGALLRGDLAEGERAAQEAFEIARQASEPDAAVVYGAQIAVVRMLQGRAAEILETITQAVAATPLVPAWRAGLADLLCWAGRLDEAREMIAEASADGFAHVPWEQTRSTALALYADAVSLAGMTDAARMLYALLQPSADQIIWSGAVVYGHAQVYLGLLAATLGRADHADEHFARACEIQERDGIVAWAARAHLGWAEALAARDERERAREQATRALELSQAHGYGAFVPRAAAILERVKIQRR